MRFVALDLNQIGYPRWNSLLERNYTLNLLCVLAVSLIFKTFFSMINGPLSKNQASNLSFHIVMIVISIVQNFSSSHHWKTASRFQISWLYSQLRFYSLSLLRHLKHFNRTISQPVANTTHWDNRDRWPASFRCIFHHPKEGQRWLSGIRQIKLHPVLEPCLDWNDMLEFKGTPACHLLWFWHVSSLGISVLRFEHLF